MEKTNRLYRSRTSRVFGGVAGGLAEYFDVDPIIIRLLFLILLIAGGGGLLVYIILWIAIPEKPLIPYENQFTTANGTSGGESAEGAQSNPGEPYFPQSRKHYQPGRGGLIGGLVLITLGCIFLADKLIPNISFHDLWPLMLVVIGAVLIITNFTGPKEDKKEQ